MLQLFDPEMIGTAVHSLLGKHPDAVTETFPLDLRGDLLHTREETIPLADVLLQDPIEIGDLFAQLHRCLPDTPGLE